jgi:hypothetical protein
MAKEYRYQCDNCEWEGDILQVEFPNIPDLVGRIMPGEEVPAGECPVCGALAYLNPDYKVH